MYVSGYDPVSCMYCVTNTTYHTAEWVTADYLFALVSNGVTVLGVDLINGVIQVVTPFGG